MSRLRLIFSIVIFTGVTAAYGDEARGPSSPQASAANAPRKLQKGKRPAPPAKSAARQAAPKPQPVDPPNDIAPTPSMRAMTDTGREPTFGLRWHGTNDKVDPYDAVNHESGPSGQGYGVQGGLNFGFSGL